MLIPVILSGGAGSRLWPVSREADPKPFMKVIGGQSLLQKTFIRATLLDQVTEILTITNRDYYFKTKDEYVAIQTPAANHNTFLLEPVGRNTAPAIILAALKIQETHGEDTVMLVLPADHLIEDQTAFADAVNTAKKIAQTGKLVTFGMVPSVPETGLGYIEKGAACAGTTAHLVSRFVEKPSLELAQEYIATGNYLWNAGIFCFTAGSMIKQFRLHAPDLFAKAQTCWLETQRKANDNVHVFEIDAATFAHLTDISIDYAIMEKAENIAVVQGDFGWSDIGSWHAISNLAPPDSMGNRIVGEALLVDVANTYVQSDGRLVAAIGLENLIIIDTPDALLVANRDRTQDVKKIVDQLKLTAHETYKNHKTVTRPWGTYCVLEEGKGFKIKRIVVKPGASLSLQMHQHRSEHWVVVSGVAKVINGDRNLIVNKDESTYIPAGHAHRLENPSTVDLILIEVQSGEYLGEDDIVRFEDKYGRVASC